MESSVHNRFQPIKRSSSEAKINICANKNPLGEPRCILEVFAGVASNPLEDFHDKD
jgi:hypothetical protein